MRNPLLSTWRDTMPPVTYADVAAIARSNWLMPLARACTRTVDARMAPLYRPLGGALMVRWLRDPTLVIEDADPLAIAAAHAMLSAWIAGSARDATAVPAHCLRADRDATARAVLRAEFERHWPALMGRTAPR